MSSIPIPVAPKSLPVLGHALPLALRRTGFLGELAACGGLVRIGMAGSPGYVLTDPDLVWRVLVTESQNYARGRMFDKMIEVLGNGLTAASGKAHREMRRLMQPSFHHERVASYAKVMTKAARELSDAWTHGEVIRVDHAMNDYTARVVNGILFTSGAGSRAAKAIQERLPLVMKGMLTRTLFPGAWERWPLPGNIRFRRSIETMDREIDAVIDTYRAGGLDFDDMLSRFLSTRDTEGNLVSDQWIHDQAITVAVGGIETTGAALAWCMHHLGQNPDMERQFHAELDGVLHGRDPEYSDVAKLPYTTRFVMEVLRKHAIAIYMRRTVEETRLGDHLLPKGAEIIVSPYALHHNPRWFPNPQAFDPDRWLDDLARRLPKGAYIPFSAGAHKCIADNLAMLEVTLGLATIGSRWRLRPVRGHKVKEVTTGATRPNKLPMMLEKRDRVRHVAASPDVPAQETADHASPKHCRPSQA